MAKKAVLGNFSTILLRAQIALASGKAVPNPFAGATTLDVFKQTVADGRKLLPHRYQARYVDVLDKVVRQAEFALSTAGRRNPAVRMAIFEQLQTVFAIVAAPIVQLRSARHQRELKAFLAEISNIYRRFINDEQVERGARFEILSPDLDPLAAFGHDHAGPFTLPASADLPVAIVSKPANQMDFLPLWAADGHEVGGHDVYGAVRGYQTDLARALEANLREAFRSGRIKVQSPTVTVPGRGGIVATLLGWLIGDAEEVAAEDFMVDVWKAWLSEAASDHAGLVNLGPMYLDSLMLLLCSVREGSRPAQFSYFDRDMFKRTSGFEEHPVDVVRVLLNIEAIRHLHIKGASGYADALMDRLVGLCGGALPRYIFWLNRKKERVVQVPLADFQATLAVVVETILDAKLPALAGQSFAEILNWTEGDEDAVSRIADRLIAGDSTFEDDVEARHVVSASMLALERASAVPGDFVKASRLIHNTGISMLVEMYDMQCLLCSVESPDTSGTPEVDMDRLFKHVRGR